MITNMDQEITFDIRDDFNRRAIAEKLIGLLLSDISISPLMIDGNWGTGKTEFCYKTINLLEAEHGDKCSPVYINAFREDHADEPVLTLLAAIVELLPEAKRNTLMEKALPALRFGLKTTLKAGVSWVLKKNADQIADEFEDALKDAGEEAANAAVERLLDDHVESQKNIQALQAAILEACSNKRLIIFVDELDRCRPDFAVSLLEYIKHVFDIPRVAFVLLANTGQLKASVRHRYGDFVEPDKYLDKFVRFSFSMPDEFRSPHRQESIRASFEHFINLVRQSENLAFLADEDYEYSLIASLIKINNLSLRDIESYVRYLNVYQLFSGSTSLSRQTIDGVNLLRIFGVYLYCFHREDALQLTKGVYACDLAKRVLGKSKIADPDSSDYQYNDADFVVAIFCLDSPNTPAGFMLNAEKQQQIDIWISRYFRGRSSISRRPSDYILQAIQVMQLAR